MHQLRLKVLQLQLYDGVSNAAPPTAPIVPFPRPGQASLLLPGSAAEAGHIQDALCDMKFRISPSAFFQVGWGEDMKVQDLPLSLLSGVWGGEGRGGPMVLPWVAGPKTKLLVLDFYFYFIFLARLP